jgi:hypothetical protein
MLGTLNALLSNPPSKLTYPHSAMESLAMTKKNEDSEFTIESLLKEILTTMGSLFSTKKLEFSATILAGTPTHCTTNRSHLRQILQHLAHNGVRQLFF